ncbi:hypothetical protein QA634_16865 [Methylobacterium sp. CB376]|uniref:hypothetical protein n=1 Tax=unclassified Methylobacterium TaxID=2615210 RepID=UPI0012377617|nr:MULTISPECIES: hypothetical protein [Methylobacterium]WFT83399.1 hypothetical protein QA634_16865 [Methylobacterium nodulans]
MHDLDAPRRAFRPGERKAIARATVFVKLAADRARTTAPLVVAGSYNRRALMTAAIAAARSHRACTGEAWSVCLSAALKGVWQVAKAARFAWAH